MDGFVLKEFISFYSVFSVESCDIRQVSQFPQRAMIARSVHNHH